MTVVVLATLGLASCTQREPVFFDIPESPAGEALDRFASQSSTEILYSVDELNLVRTNRIYGSFTRDEAIQRLLDGTPLVYATDSKSGAIAVWKKDSRKLN